MSLVDTPTPSLRRSLPPLLAAHAVGLLTPLLTVPYLARILRPEGWAPVLMAQGLVVAVSLLLEFGAELTGVRAVAAARAAAAGELAFRRTVWGIQASKLLLLPVALFVVVAVYAAVPALRVTPALALWTAVAAIARGCSPLWYFLGVERSQWAIGVETACRVAGALLVLPFITSPADGWIVLAGQGVAMSLVLLLLMRRLSAEVPRPRNGTVWLAARGALAAGRTIFAYRLAGSAFNYTNTLLLGTVAPGAAVAAYGGAERIVRAVTGLLDPLTRAILPRMSALRAQESDAAIRLFGRLLPAIVGLAAVGAVALALAAPWLIPLLLGPGYEAAIPIMRWLTLLLPIVATGTVLGFFWALPTGRDRLVLWATATAGVAAIIAVITVVPRTGAMGMVGVAIGGEAVVATILLAAYLRRAPRGRTH